MGRGRPAKAEADKKQEFSVWLTPGERQELADRFGSLSSALRTLLGRETQQLGVGPAKGFTVAPPMEVLDPPQKVSTALKPCETCRRLRKAFGWRGCPGCRALNGVSVLG